MAQGQASRPRVYFRDRAALRAWLEANHASHGSIWLEYDRAERGVAGATSRLLTYDDIVEEALCFGWIDSVTGSVSPARARLYFSPRKPGGGWSALNKKRIAKLEEAGLLHESGLAKIKAAKADGSWTALDAIEALRMPADLGDALSKRARAKANYDAFPPGAKKQILAWVLSAKRPETRRARIDEVVRLAGLNIRAGDPQARKDAAAKKSKAPTTRTKRGL